MDVDANVDPDTGLPPLKKLSNGDDDDDPLDAFMRANNAKADAAVAKAAARVPAPVVRAKPGRLVRTSPRAPWCSRNRRAPRF
jgi:hypothetical protein